MKDRIAVLNERCEYVSMYNISETLNFYKETKPSLKWKTNSLQSWSDTLHNTCFGELFLENKVSVVKIYLISRQKLPGGRTDVLLLLVLYSEMLNVYWIYW